MIKEVKEAEANGSSIYDDYHVVQVGVDIVVSDRRGYTRDISYVIEKALIASGIPVVGVDFVDTLDDYTYSEVDVDRALQQSSM